VGRRNYRSFFWFVNTLWFNALFVLINESVDLSLRADYHQEALGASLGSPSNAALRGHPLSIPMILYGVAALIAVSILLVYHYKITLDYLTTHEDLKSIYRGYLKHPYSLGSSPRSLDNVLNRLIWEWLPQNLLFQPHSLTKVPQLPAPTFRTIKGKTTFETQIEEKVEVNPELDMKVTAIEPDRDDFDRLD
jgi:hypothetical protein